ncbi:MAG: hypothetical protein F4X36_08920 [Gammaproteobacteria bacterium]|nr:hypothetical protein [Gammaproteobacteria bacterium]
MKTGRNDPCPCGSGKKYKLLLHAAGRDTPCVARMAAHGAPGGETERASRHPCRAALRPGLAGGRLARLRAGRRNAVRRRRALRGRSR